MESYAVCGSDIYIPSGYENNKYRHCKDVYVIWHLTFRKVIKEMTASQTFEMWRKCALDNYFQVFRKLFNTKAVGQIEMNDCFCNTFQMTISFYPISNLQNKVNKLNIVSTCALIFAYSPKMCILAWSFTSCINHWLRCLFSALISPCVKSE